MVIITTSFSGAILVETEFGVVTVSASDGLNLVVRMKKDKQQKSHIAHCRHIYGCALSWYFNFWHCL